MPDWASLRAEFPLLDRYVYVGGLGTLASGLPLPPGRDKVLIGALGFPSPTRARAALRDRHARAWDGSGAPARGGQEIAAWAFPKDGTRHREIGRASCRERVWD